ncbi:MAG: PEP-CTERM sorting domain-containing protein [Fimbriimonadaceae bacterium]
MKKITSIIALATFATAAFAQDTTNLKFVGVGKGRSDITINYDGNRANVFAGELKHLASGGVGSLKWLDGQTISTFCSEPAQYVSRQGTGYTQVDIPQLDPNAWKINGDAKRAAVNNLFRYGFNSVTGAGADSSRAAAFQIAVWKIGYDFDGSVDSLNLGTGRFRAGMKNGGSLDAQIQVNLNDLLNGATAVGPERKGVTRVIAFHSDCNQDQITAVPEPATLAAIGIGLAGIMRRRKKA